MEISGSRAVVTGAATGIGRGIALALADAGAEAVVVADVNLERADAVCKEVRQRGADAHARRCDVRHRVEIEALADFAWSQIGGVDILFNNAGVGRTGLAFDLPDDDIAWQVEVNLMGVIHGTRVFGRRMLDGPAKGWICNTASHAGVSARDPMLAAYTATKHGVVGYTDALRNDYGDRLGLSLLCPGVVNSDMWQAGLARPVEFGGPVAGDPAVKAFIAEHGLDPEDVGRTAVSGVRDEAFFIWTHPFTVELAGARWSEERAASERQWPMGGEGRPRPAAYRPLDV